jgi:glyoxylase-like metal-dependent hydrolase (beta-lactamase superfamily II)
MKTFVFNSFMVNGYLLFDETGEAVSVDISCSTGREERELSGFIDTNGLTLVMNINTHCHIDHILGNDFIEAHYKIRPVYHRAGIPFFITAREIADSFGFRLDRIPEPAKYLEDGELLRWGKTELQVLYTPGHAEGSICLYNQHQGFVITGDVLFRDSIGRTDLPGGNFDQLMKSIREKLFTLPDDTVVYPGHGPDTTIGYEKRNNPFII